MKPWTLIIHKTASQDEVYTFSSLFEVIHELEIRLTWQTSLKYSYELSGGHL